jgi:hypothetical protein
VPYFGHGFNLHPQELYKVRNEVRFSSGIDQNAHASPFDDPGVSRRPLAESDGDARALVHPISCIRNLMIDDVHRGTYNTVVPHKIWN